MLDPGIHRSVVITQKVCSCRLYGKRLGVRTSLEDEVAREGPLIYGRDDIEGRERVTVPSANHPKFYKIIPKPKEIKSQTLE
jgi:hypothetical protein